MLNMDTHCNSRIYLLDLPGIEEVTYIQYSKKEMFSLLHVKSVHLLAASTGCVDISFLKPGENSAHHIALVQALDKAYNK